MEADGPWERLHIAWAGQKVGYKTGPLRLFYGTPLFYPESAYMALIIHCALGAQTSFCEDTLNLTFFQVLLN